MNQKLKFKGRILSAIFSTIMCIILTSCAKDDLSLMDSQKGDKIKFQLNIPTSTQVTTRASTAASAAELEIKYGYCLIYSDNSASNMPEMTYTFDLPKDITSGSNGTANPVITIPKNITIKSTDIVIFIFNTKFLGDESFGDRLDDVQYDQIGAKFPLAGKSGFETTTGDGIPMYGKLTGFTNSGTQIMTIYRSVAKVQVKLKSPMTGSAANVGDFITTNVKYKLFNIAITGNVNPGTGFNNTTTEALNSNDQNKAPETTIDGIINKETVISTSNDNYTGGSYIYEYHYSNNIIGTNSSTNISANTPSNDRLAIILHNSSNDRYYRLDLCNIGPEYIDIIRNHHYQIVINEVNSDGYATADEAIGGSASNILYEIIDNTGTTTISNGKYAISVGEEFYANSSIATTESITIADDLRYILPVGLSLPAGVTNNIIIINPVTKDPIDPNVLTVSPNTLSNAGTPLTVTFADLTFSGEIAFKITLGDLSYESAPITIVSTTIIGAVVNFGTDQNPVWIEVADRNAEIGGINGATAGNSNTDYGSFYYWSNDTYFTADTDKAYQACYNFGEGNGTWRLPTGNEMIILNGNSTNATSSNSPRKLQHNNNTWTLHDERPGYENHFVYLPLSGHYSASGTGNVDVQGYYWSSARNSNTVYPLVLGADAYSHISNYNLGGNGVGFSVRCLRNVVEYNMMTEENCYFIPMSGQNILIPAIDRVNTFWNGDGSNSANTIGSSDEWYAEVIWADFDYTIGDKIIIKQNGATESDFGIGNVNLGITIGTLTKPGNVIIGVKKKGATTEAGEYLWSWHLWITDYDPNTRTDSKMWTVNETFPTIGGQVHSYDDPSATGLFWRDEYNGAVFMDRNLGAILSVGNGEAVNKTTVGIDAFGMSYQWGRKDPIPYAHTMSFPDGSRYAFINTYGKIQRTDNKWPSNSEPYEPKSKSFGVNNPHKFIIANAHDWQTPSNNNSWVDEKGTKSLYDPCPDGWKVPHKDMFSNFNKNNLAISGAAPNVTYGRSYVDGNVSAWFPAAGFIYNNTESMGYAGRLGAYWSSTSIDENLANIVYYESNFVITLNVMRSYGFSVRCIKESIVY